LIVNAGILQGSVATYYRWSGSLYCCS